MMSESDFNRRVDALLLSIEEAFDASGVDLDYETAGGILTVRFNNGSQLVINRQTPVRQVWVAAKGGGFHFDFDGQVWRGDRDGRELFQVLSELAGAQAGEAVSLR